MDIEPFWGVNLTELSIILIKTCESLSFFPKTIIFSLISQLTSKFLVCAR